MELTKEQIDIILAACKAIQTPTEDRPEYSDYINLAGATGTNTKNFDRVKPGRLLAITHMSIYDDTSSPTKVRLGYFAQGRNNWVKSGIAPLISETIEFTGLLLLYEGMYPVVRWEGVTSGDDLYAHVSGYWLKM